MVNYYLFLTLNICKRLVNSNVGPMGYMQLPVITHQRAAKAQANMHISADYSVPSLLTGGPDQILDLSLRWIRCQFRICYMNSITCVNGHSKIDKTKYLNDKW